VTTGQEVGRHFTPEPNVAVLFGLGLMGFGLLGGTAAARRARR
jgi:hypothetical protein